MAFNTIGQKTVWDNWGTYGAGSWNMWFMAPYGSWMYCGFSKNNVSEFKRVYIGSDLLDYDIYDWEFDSGAINTPDLVFPSEPFEGFPNGSMDMGCIREGTGTYLYLAGHYATPPSTDTIIHRFDALGEFAQYGLGIIPCDPSSARLNINRICGLEVKPNNGVFIIVNNTEGGDYTLYRYAYTWSGTDEDPQYSMDLTPYIYDNTQSRVRGMATASDGSILVFCNTGETATATTVLKFNADTLAYLGRTAWIPASATYDAISTAIWAHAIKSGEIFLYFQGLDSTSYSARLSHIYYDNSTGIPEEKNSNFIIEDNLTTFGDDDALQLKYIARDGFNNVVVSTNCKFIISGVLQNDPSSWDATVGGVQELSGNEFFDSDGVPLSVHAITPTDSTGTAVAYYKPMREGTGTFIDLLNVFCPADN